MKKIISLALMVLAIAGLGIVYFVSSGEDDIPAEGTAPVEQRVSTDLMDRTESETLRVDFNGQFSLIPYPGEEGIDWLWEAYPETVLEPMQARDLARTGWHLTNTELLHESLDDLDLNEFGLAPAQYVITSYFADGSQQTLYIGHPTADRRGYFIKLAGETQMYTWPNVFAHRAMGGIESVLNRRIPQFTIDAHRMVIDQADRPVIDLAMGISHVSIDQLSAMVAGLDGAILRMVAPIDQGLDHGRMVVHLFERLEIFRMMDVETVMPDSLTPYGLDTPVLDFLYADELGDVRLLFGDRFLQDTASGQEERIYVKYYDRPHVFSVPFRFVDALFDLNIFSIIERSVHLERIIYIDNITITGTEQAVDKLIVINNGPDNTIAPTINGVAVDDSDFRVSYRLLISLQMEGEIDPWPLDQAPPAFTITYNRLDGSAAVVDLYRVDANLLAISINGGEARFVTHMRDLHMFFSHIEGIMP